MRYALYYTPAEGTALAGFGAGILGYDACSGKTVSREALSGVSSLGMEELTREPRLYGFHATLKAPMALKDDQSEADLIAAVEVFARHRPAASLGPLKVAAIGGFLALAPVSPCPAVAMLAAECVAHFDAFRAPLTPGERERRVRQGLSPRQTALLDRWGYPHVFEEFRFHMTLTGLLPDRDRGAWLDRLETAFGDLAREDVVVDALSVLRQDERGAPFRVIRRAPFGA